MAVLYIDCQYGIAGDMMLASLIDLGADMDYISEQLRMLPIDSFELEVKTVIKNAIQSKKLELSFHTPQKNFLEKYHDSLVQHGGEEQHEHTHNHPHHEHHHHSAQAILDMIMESNLPSRVKERSHGIFTVIAEAESKIHGMPVAEVHFHEVGAMDSIIDIIGVSLALESLKIDTIYATRVPVGHGLMHMAHGLFPIPAPATLELLKDIPLSDFSIESELTTPTGAGILKALVTDYTDIPNGKVKKIGYGAGEKQFEHPNVLRTMLLDEVDRSTTEEIITLTECQLDDITAEQLSNTTKNMMEMTGVLDVFVTPITMKKSRLGYLLTILSDIQYDKEITEYLFFHTPTLDYVSNTSNVTF